MLSATRKEWNELYVFFTLLHKGSVSLGNEEGKPSDRVLPIYMISRQEHDGERKYYVEEEMIRVVSSDNETEFPREDFGTVLDMILSALRENREDEVAIFEEVTIFNIGWKNTNS